ncbi:MAG: ParB/RepB/Spo0J family partition protein [Pyrinomonadaceae bacterium]|nr:ParB/RepB/Spo0J family partition protein [Pyrinomonadaceae bacterium]
MSKTKEKPAKPPKVLPEENTAQVIISNSIIAIPTGEIFPSSFDFAAIRRQTYREEDLLDLGLSIKSSMQIEPAIVRWIESLKKHEIISGERRWRAVQKVGIETLDCVVRNLTDVQALEVQYKENHDRQDNDPLVDAFLFKHLHEKENFSITEIRDKFNIKSNKDVLEMILLNDLIDEAKIQLSKKLLPKRHALKIASFKPKVQEKIIAGNFAYRGNNIENRPLPFEQFEEIIEDNFGRKLEKAPFDTEDPRLHVYGLKCLDCKENTINQPDLFGMRFDGDAACLNADCFNLKASTFFRLQREEAALRLPNPENKPISELSKEVPVVATRPTTEKAFGETVIYTPVIEQPECPFSIPAIIGDGDDRNRSKWTCTNETCEIHFPKEQKPKMSHSDREKLERELNEKIKKEARVKVFKSSIAFFDDYKPFWMYNDLISALILRLWDDSGYDVQNFIFTIIKTWKNCPSNHQSAAFEIWIGKLTKVQQSRLLFLLTYKLEGFYSNSDTEGLARLFREFADGNFKLLDAQIRYELAPLEFKAKAEDYLGHVQNGYEIEIPKFWLAVEETGD